VESKGKAGTGKKEGPASYDSKPKEAPALPTEAGRIDSSEKGSFQGPRSSAKGRLQLTENQRGRGRGRGGNWQGGNPGETQLGKKDE